MVVQKVELAEYVDKIFWDIFDRMAKNPLMLAFPNLFLKQITESDKRYFINARAIRNFIKEIIKDRVDNGIPEDEDIDMISVII